MKLILFALLIPVATYSAQERFYIGTYTGPGKGEGIYSGVIDSDTGRLGLVSLAIKANNPNYLAAAPDGRHLYAVTSDSGGSVEAFGIGNEGALLSINEVSSDGSGPCYLSVDPSGKNVLVANYGSGVIACISIRPDGSAGARSSQLVCFGSGPDPVRQKGSHPHFVSTDSTGHFVYACDLGTDEVLGYRFDASPGVAGALGGRFESPVKPISQVPPGSGARHLAFGPGEHFAYVNGEMGRNVTVFRRDKATGCLTAIQTLPLVPGAGPAKGVFTAEIACHPSGKWLYVSSRGDDIIAVFAIGADGRLTFVQEVPSVAKFPRGFGIDPSGRWLIVAGQNDGRLAVLAIAGESGKLTATGQTAAVPSPVCVVFPAAQ